MPFLLVNVPLDLVLVTIKVTGTMYQYQLKLSALCDLLEILCTLGPEVEAPTKQDCFQC